MPIAEIIGKEEEYSNKSLTRQKTMRDVLRKIKLSRGRRVKEYINKHRRFFGDMKEAGMPEANLEVLNIHAIIYRTAKNGAWNEFWTSLSICQATEYPTTIKALEKMMLDFAAKCHDTKWNKLDWRVSAQQDNRDGHGKEIDHEWGYRTNLGQQRWGSSGSC